MQMNKPVEEREGGRRRENMNRRKGKKYKNK